MRFVLATFLLVIVAACGCTKGNSSPPTGVSSADRRVAETSPPAVSALSKEPAPPVPAKEIPSCRIAWPAGQPVDAQAINKVVLPGYDAQTGKVATLAVPKEKQDPNVSYGVQPCRGEILWTDAYADTFKKGEVKTAFIPGRDWTAGMYLAWIKVGELPGMDAVEVGFRALVHAKDGTLEVEALGPWQSTSGHDVDGFHKIGDQRYMLERHHDAGEESPTISVNQIWLVKDGSWVNTGTITRSYEELRNYPLGDLKRAMGSKIEPNSNGFTIRETWTFEPEEPKKGKSKTKTIERRATFSGGRWVVTPEFEAPKP